MKRDDRRLSEAGPAFVQRLGISAGVALVLVTLPVAGAGRADAAGAAPRGEVLVFAAASLAEPLERLGDRFARTAGIEVAFNFASTGSLAQQIKLGAPAGIFIGADTASVDGLEKAGWVLAWERHDLLTNTLAVVVPAASKLEIGHPRDLASPRIRRIALGDPQLVPAGIYAKSYLRALGIWEAVQPKIVPALDVRACLAAVESGNVDAGIVYVTDARGSPRVRLAYEVPRADGPPIRYVAALVRGRQTASARAFMVFLLGDDSRRVFAAAGFVPLF